MQDADFTPQQSVVKRYFDNETARAAVHSRLADYFGRKLLVAGPKSPWSANMYKWNDSHKRALTAYPYHVINSRNWRQVERLLTDLTWIQARSRIGLGGETINDVKESLSAIQPRLKRLKSELEQFSLPDVVSWQPLERLRNVKTLLSRERFFLVNLSRTIFSDPSKRLPALQSQRTPRLETS